MNTTAQRVVRARSIKRPDGRLIDLAEVGNLVASKSLDNYPVSILGNHTNTYDRSVFYISPKYPFSYKSRKLKRMVLA